MKHNRKIIVVSIIILVLLAVLFGTIRFINKKSSPDGPEEREITVYFPDQQALYLKPEKRKVKSNAVYRNTVKTIIDGPKDPVLNKSVPEGVRLLGLEVEAGLARVDFNQALIDNHWGGSTGERMTVYSIVNSLTQFSDINRVKIVIEGKTVDTLAGHMDLSTPLTRNEKIIKN